MAGSPKAARAVVLLSGGMDSCVTAAIAAREGPIAVLHASYGQRTEGRELKAFHAVADYLGAERRLTARLDHLAKIGGSSLTDQRIPVTEADLGATSIPSSYVPFRNAHFLAIATSWAETIGARRIYIGAVCEDSSGYPDCRPEYYAAMNELIRVGTRPETEITVETPLIHLTKRDIVLRGRELGAPLHLTWSCYRDEEVACGACDSCALRLRAFQEAGVEDPIAYAARPAYART